MKKKPRVAHEDMDVIYKLVDARADNQSVEDVVDKFVTGILNNPVKSGLYNVSEDNKTKRIATMKSSYYKYRRNNKVSRPTKARTTIVVPSGELFPMKFDVKQRTVIIENKAQFEYITALAR
jgi:hypothetical protein